MVDGKRQRNALTAAERAIRSLGAGDGDRAVANAAKAADLDQVGSFAALPGAVSGAARQLREMGSIDEASWDAVSEAVGSGPLAYLVAEVRDD